MTFIILLRNVNMYIMGTYRVQIHILKIDWKTNAKNFNQPNIKFTLNDLRLTAAANFVSPWNT